MDSEFSTWFLRNCSPPRNRYVLRNTQFVSAPWYAQWFCRSYRVLRIEGRWHNCDGSVIVHVIFGLVVGGLYESFS